MNPPLSRDLALLLVLGLLVVLTVQVMWLTGGRDRLARIGEAAVNLLGRVADRPSAVRSPDRAVGAVREPIRAVVPIWEPDRVVVPVWQPEEAVVPVRDQQLEDELAAAKSEIERLRARIAQMSRDQTSSTHTRAEEIATARQRRLWIARGGHRQSQTNR